MNTKGKFSILLDELVAGNPHSHVIQANLDLILTWLARPDSDKVKEFKDAYRQRNISDEILRGYVLFILEQKLFVDDKLPAYQIFGLNRNATKEEIKSRYRKLIRVYHPDLGIGDVRILHHHSEKINQAYTELSNNQAEASEIVVPAYSAQTTSLKANNISSGYKEDSAVAKKLRRKFGDAKRFQLIFFGSVASLCLLLILLVSIQPDPDNSAQVIPSHEADQKLQFVDNDKAVKPTTLEAESSNLNQENSNLPENEGLKTEIKNENRDSETDIQLTNINNSINTQAVGDTELKLDESGNTLPVVSENISDNINLDKQDDFIEQIQDPLQEEAGQENQAAQSEDNAIQEVSKTSDVAITNINSKAISNNITQKKNNEIVSTEKKAPEKKLKEKKSSKSDLAKSQTKVKKAVEVVSVESEITDNKLSEKTNENSEGVPVREVEISSIFRVTKNFTKANIFERRFSRNFVVKYLESIERGNISLINEFLADELSVNGVSNYKYSYLRNITEMISNSSKRSYNINFIGDVLRLDKGSFRVTLREWQTVIYKNNRKSQISKTKSYDIKRYNSGSEIVSISDV